MNNFRNMIQIKDYCYADVSVWSMWPPFRRMERIFRKKHGKNWMFLSTGALTPDSQAEDLERAYRAQANLLGLELSR